MEKGVIAQVISRTSCSSGGSIQAVLLAKGINDLGFKVYFVSKGGDCENRAIQLGIAHVKQSMKWTPGSIVSFVSFVKKNNVKVLHAHKGKALSFSILASFIIGGLKVFANRGVSFSLSWTNRWKYRIPFTSGVICVSNHLRGELQKREGIPPYKIFTVYGSVDDRFFGSYDRKVVEKELGLGDKNFYISMIGNLRPQKGHKICASAIKELSKKIKGLKFMVAGKEEGTIIESLKDLLGDDFIFLGYRRDVEKVIVASDIVVNASSFEGIPGAVRESMVLGRPVVVSSIPGNLEIVEDGNTGLVFRLDDVSQLERKILFLWKNPKVRRVLALNARRFASKFTLRRRVESILRLYGYM